MYYVCVVVVVKRTVCTTRSPSEAAAVDNCTGIRSHNHWPYNV